ncbi:MAG: NAD(P)-dependent oxidoreductase [Betaproteobacteria bacterium]|nr:NAD(P)-dependent oxidoreductase [Betaproteobacteria bacterium]
MRICITGGLGVIGSWITRAIIRKGMRPVVLSRNKDFSLLPDCVGAFDYFPCDIQDSELINKIFMREKIERLIHAAAITMALSERDPVEAVRVNDVGTATVMNAAGKQNLERVVFLSSGSIYDQWSKSAADRKIRIDENFPIRPIHISRITKVCAEEIGRYFSRRYGFQFVAIRSSTMYGPGKLRHHGSMAIHSLLIENAIQGLPTKVSQGGDQEDDIIYAADIAEGVVSACFCEKLSYDVYNIASGKAITLLEFADAVRTVFPFARMEIGAGKNYLGTGLVTDRVFDISRAHQDLDFRPKYDTLSAIDNYRSMLELFESKRRVGL